jgi:hypothetical protein
MSQRRTVVLSRLVPAMPTAVVVVPAPVPSRMKPLQSMVTLLAVTLMALPLAMLVARLESMHQMPGAFTVAGSEAMTCSQASKLSAARAGRGASAAKARRARSSRESRCMVVFLIAEARCRRWRSRTAGCRNRG